jgi:hypothetical protein
MREIETSLDISAPRERVWDILTEFRAWDEWNPVITRMRATLSPNAPVSFVIAIGGRELKIKSEMLRVEHGREICWHGPPSAALGFFVRGEHYLVVEGVGPARSRIIHGERFDGVLVPVIWKNLGRELEKAYSEMNRALKARAESPAGGLISSVRGG